MPESPVRQRDCSFFTHPQVPRVWTTAASRLGLASQSNSRSDFCLGKAGVSLMRVWITVV